MNKLEMSDLTDKVIHNVRSNYGHTLKTQVLRDKFYATLDSTISNKNYTNCERKKNMNNFEMCDLIVKELFKVKSDYGCILKTQDYIYILYGRVLDKLSDHELSFSDLNRIAYLIRKEVQAIEEKEH